MKLGEFRSTEGRVMMTTGIQVTYQVDGDIPLIRTDIIRVEHEDFRAALEALTEKADAGQWQEWMVNSVRYRGHTTTGEVQWFNVNTQTWVQDSADYTGAFKAGMEVKR